MFPCCSTFKHNYVCVNISSFKEQFLLPAKDGLAATKMIKLNADHFATSSEAQNVLVVVTVPYWLTPRTSNHRSPMVKLNVPWTVPSNNSNNNQQINQTQTSSFCEYWNSWSNWNWVVHWWIPWNKHHEKRIIEHKISDGCHHTKMLIGKCI